MLAEASALRLRISAHLPRSARLLRVVAARTALLLLAAPAPALAALAALRLRISARLPRSALLLVVAAHTALLLVVAARVVRARPCPISARLREDRAVSTALLLLQVRRPVAIRSAAEWAGLRLVAADTALLLPAVPVLRAALRRCKAHPRKTSGRR